MRQTGSTFCNTCNYVLINLLLSLYLLVQIKSEPKITVLKNALTLRVLWAEGAKLELMTMNCVKTLLVNTEIKHNSQEFI